MIPIHNNSSCSTIGLPVIDFRAGSAACDLASKQALKPSHELGCSQRTSCSFGAAQLAEIVLHARLQKFFEMRNSVQYGPHCDQCVVHAGEVRAHAGPLPILGFCDQSGAHRVQADIANGADEVGIVQHDRGKAALEQMTGPASARVDEVSVTPVGFSPTARPRPSLCVGFRIR
jgi:hypothetical protein